MAPSPNSSGPLKIIDTQALPAGGLSIVSSQPLHQDPGFMENLWDSFKAGINPGPALKEWWNRSDENKAIGDALAVGIKARGRQMTPDEQATFDKGSQAMAARGSDPTNPLGGNDIVPPGSQPAITAGSQAAQGNVGGAVGTLLSGYGVPAVIGKALGSETAANLGTAAKAGVKASVSDVALGSLKVGAGAGAAEMLPGESGAVGRWVLMYPGARQIAAGFAKGATAARDAWQLARLSGTPSEANAINLPGNVARDIVPPGSTPLSQATGEKWWQTPPQPRNPPVWANSPEPQTPVQADTTPIKPDTPPWVIRAQNRPPQAPTPAPAPIPRSTGPIDIGPRTGVGPTPAERLAAEFPQSSLGERLAIATASVGGEDTALLEGIAKGQGLKSFAKATPEQQAVVRQLAVRIGQNAPRVAPEASPQTPVTAAPPSTPPNPMADWEAQHQALMNSAEAARTKFGPNGESVSPQTRGENVTAANAVAKGDRLGPAMGQKFRDAGLSADDLGKIPAGRVAIEDIQKGATPGWGNVMDDLKAQGVIDPKETTPNLSIPRIQFYLRQLEALQPPKQ